MNYLFKKTEECCEKPCLCYPDPPCYLTCLNCGVEDTGDRTTEEEYKEMYEKR